MAFLLHRVLPLTALFLVVVPATEGILAAPVAHTEAEAFDDIRVDEEDRPFRISAPQPNPFVSATRFELVVEERVDLSVTVFDALGREVVKLHSGSLEPGSYPLSFDGEGLPTGLYVIRAMDSHGAIATRSVALVR